MTVLGKVNRDNISERVYTIIGSAMMEGQFESGQRLKISEIAKALEVSITPVREAIFRLVSEGALEMRTATAVHVPRRSAWDLRQIKSIRLSLEGMAAEAAATVISDENLAQLMSLQKEFLKVVTKDAKKANELNRKFHFILAEASGMDIVVHCIENMWRMIGPTITDLHRLVPERELTGQHKHEAVLAALRENDAEGAKRAIQEDIEWGNVVIEWVEQREKSNSQLD